MKSNSEIYNKIKKFISKYGTTDGERNIYYFKGDERIYYNSKAFDLLYMAMYEVCGAQNNTFDLVPQFLAIEVDESNGEDTTNQVFFSWEDLSPNLQKNILDRIASMENKLANKKSVSADEEIVSFVCSQLEKRGLTFYTTTDGKQCFAYVLVSKLEKDVLEGRCECDYPLVLFEEESALKKAINAYSAFFAMAEITPTIPKEKYYPYFSPIEK